MRKVFDKLHHHGKKVYKHAQKHHKKYFWGAAGFFGIFKLFSFLIVSIFSYTTIINASLQSPISVAIPATTIDIQEGKSIIQFDLSDVDLGNYSDIQNIDLRMNIETQKQTIDMETLRNSTTTSIGKQDITNLISLQLWKTAEKIRTVNTEQLPQIIQQLLTGNTVIYFLPQENINIQSGTIFMELEVGETTPTKQSQTGNGEDGNSEFITGNLQPETGDLKPETGDLQPETGDLKYEIMQKNINTKKDKTIINNAKTLKNIALESKDKKIHIKIPKDTKIHNKDGTDFEGTIQEPQKLNVEEIEFDPKEKAIYAFEVGDPQQSIMFKNQKQQSQYLEIKVYLDDERIQSGKQVMVYYSEDKTTRNTMGSYTIQADEQGFFVNIISDHMTTFLIGETSFEFFIGDSGCKPIVDISDTEKVYACITGDPNALKLIKSMQFSNISQEDLEKQVWLEYRTPYDIILPKETRGNVTLRARYAYDKDKKIRGTTSDIYTITKRLGFNSFIGNSKGNELTEIENTQTYVYMREQAQDRNKISQERYSINNKKEILNKSRNAFKDNQIIDISQAEGTTTIYTQYMYTPDGKLYYPGEIISDTINIKKIEETSSILNDGSTIPQDDKLTIDSMYRTVTSSLGSVTIDSKASTTNIQVSNQDWNGILYAPTTAQGDQAAQQGEMGLPIKFVPSQTIMVGSDNGASLTLDNGKYFTVSFTVNDTSLRDQTIDIYYSQDGATRNGGLSCTVTTQGICTFQTDHLTLFTIGATAAVYMTWNNMEFLNQDFRDTNPTSGQITDALFKSSLSNRNTTAYTWHWRSSEVGMSFDPYPCRPTTVTYLTATTRAAFTVPANTIYVLHSGHHTQNGSITMSGCSALVGSGDVTISKNGNFNLITAAPGTNQIILDNLSLNGSGNNSYTISFIETYQFTINNIQAYNGASYGIYVSAGADGMISNSQVFNNSSIGIYLNSASYNIIHNSQVFNNGSYGIYNINTKYSTINDSQIYNNANIGIYSATATGFVLNNSQIYKNSGRGIYISNSPNFSINNIRSFHNTSYNIELVGTSSGYYYSTNLIPISFNTGNLYQGPYNSTLGWNTGTRSASNPASDCRLLTQPAYENLGLNLFYGPNCTTVGRNTSRIVGATNKVKYMYGNDFANNVYPLQQIMPTRWYAGITIPVNISLTTSAIPYHGHRFIGEYYNPSGNDINNPVMIFTGSTPPQGTNIITGAYSGYFTTNTYIYEPNIYLLKRYENFGGTSTHYAIYDSGLVFMANFDNITEIGESSTLVRDLSTTRAYGITTGQVIWTGNGKRNSAYYFSGSATSVLGYIEISNNQNLDFTDAYTLMARVKPNSLAAYEPIFVRGTTSANDIETYIQSSSANSFVILHNRANGGTQSYVSGRPSPSAGQRTHVVITFSGINSTQGEIRLYHNGTLLNTGTINKPLDTNRERTIGGTKNTLFGSNRYFKGSIDEPRIRNRALTSGEIQHLYNSNLAAKPNYREYTTNYTGVQLRPNGIYTYGFTTAYPLTDTDSNTATATGYVVKHLNCGTGFTITRNNNNLINSGFRNANPGHCDIVLALFGSGTSGTDLTAYTNHRNGRNGECNYQNMNIEYLTGGTDKIPSALSPNTIYVLASGTYIQTQTINMNSCSAIIGATGSINMYSTSTLSPMIYDDKGTNILDNLYINGIANGGGGTHTRNDIGIHKFKGQNATINNIILHEIMERGIYLDESYGYAGIYQSQIYEVIKGAGIDINGSRNNILSGLQIFDNAHGIQSISSENIISNSQIYSNLGGGIYMANRNYNIIMNNLQIFNNKYGIQSADAGNKNYITLNNSQIYNNSGDGVLLYRSSYFTINNTHIYNNSGNGIYFASTNNDRGILNNTFSYNNGDVGISSNAGTHTYYSRITMFNNLGGNIAGTFNPGNGSTYSYLGRTAGTTNTSPCMNCSRATNPRTPGPGYERLVNITTYPKCDKKGQDLSRNTTGGIGYKYGISLTGQKLPVYRSGTTTLTGIINIGYNGSQYVAEVNKIGTYTDTQCSCLVGHTYRRNNDQFISNTGFWNHTPAPDYCDIIAAVYGTGTAGQDDTAYSDYRNSNRVGQCNTENIQVVYVTGGTNKLPTDLENNKIYVLNAGSYNHTYQISDMVGGCNALLGSGSVILNSTGTFTNGLVNIGENYNVIDNIIFDGSGGNIQYGLSLGSLDNATIHQASAINNIAGGFKFTDTTYSLFQDISAYNNRGNGIYVRQGSHYNEHTTLNNGMAYNNSGYGIDTESTNRFSINNFQVYNNNSGGIRIGTFTYSFLNNLQIYNNAGYGIEKGGNTITNISDIAIYNNSGSMNVQNVGTIHFYNNLWIFGNIVNAISGTIYTGRSDDFSYYYPNDGQLIDTGTMSRDYITNPKNNAGAFLLSFTGYSFTGLIGNKPFGISRPIVPSYGSGIYTQKAPIIYSGSNPIEATTIIYSGDQFIGSNIKKITGDLLGVPTITSSSGLTVMGISSSPLVTRYAVRGNIANIYSNMNLGTSTGIFLDNSVFGTKRIVTFLYKQPNSDGFLTHFEKQTTFLIDPCLSGWNNDNFIDDTFRAQSPSDANIICALYGSGGNDQTAYTRTWNAGGYDHTYCLDAGMTVSYPGSIPTSTTSRTIYVLPNGTYNLTGVANLNSCVTFISSGNTTISANNNGYYIGLKNYGIIDNITFNGTNTATYGIYAGSSIGNTVHNTDIAFTSSDGVRIVDSDYQLIINNDIHENHVNGINIGKFADRNIIENNKIFENLNDGIFIVNSQENIISNNQIAGNGNHGISIYQSSENTAIKNNAIFNNTLNGIYIDDYSNYTFINNNNIYNNAQYGIQTTSITARTNINNTLVYNNSYGIVSNGESDLINNCDTFNNSTNGIISEGYGLWIAKTRTYNNGEYGLVVNGGDMYYFDDIYSFGNGNGPYSLNSENQGSANTDFDWTDGMLYDDQYQYNYIDNPLSRDYLMNPKDNAAVYLLSWNTDDMGAARGQFGFTADMPIGYSYGSGILGQSVPVLRDVGNSQYITGGTYTGENYIGGGPIKYTGNLLIPAVSYTTGLTVTGQANASQISGYNLYGTDLFTDYLGMTINTQTGIFFNAGDGTKRIITQIYSPTYFATHFEKSTTLNSQIDCAYRWNNDNFITGAFRAGNPLDENIICALYGTGPGDTTAYTQLWSGWNTTQCSGIQMNVVYTGKLQLNTLSANTIYVMTDGYSTGINNFSMANCSAVISRNSTGTTFYSTTQISNIFYLNNVGYTIFDNININGTGGGIVPNHSENSYGILMNTTTNNTMNNMSIYNHSNGIYGSSAAKYNTINNIRTYNNSSNGITLFSTSNNNRINNTQVYNTYYGIYLDTAANNSINNTQVYNNRAGILLGNNTSGNSVNNCQIFNNSYLGLWFISTTTYNNINNTRIINNGWTELGRGMHLNGLATNNKYYGTNEIFGNYTNLGGSYGLLTAGSSSDYPGIFSNGTLSTAGTMSWDYITNPINTNNSYLSLRSGAFTGSTVLGQQNTYKNTVTSQYSYGSGILTQIQPVRYNGATLKTGGVFDTNNYIGSIDTIKKNGDLLGISPYSPATFIVTGTSTSPVTKYSIFGDITTFRIGANINTQSTGITLITGLSTNRIVTQIYDPTNYFATHFQKNTLYNIPTITGIQIFQTIGHITGLNITYFAPYQLEATLSGNALTGAVDLIGINGNGGSCIDYYASGSCAAGGGSTSFSYPLVYSGNNIRIKTGVYPDQLYPEIFFAPSNISRYNTGVQSRITANNYTLIHMINPYTMTGSTSFWIELSASSGTNPNVVDLQVYLIKSGTNISFFNGSDWRTNPGVQLVGAVTKTTAYSHTHTQGTVNKSDYLISLSTNSNGTIGTKNIDINGDFRIALYADTNSTTRGRDLKYYSGTVCENTSGRYRGNVGAGRTTTRQSGCPDTHIHVARQSTYFDGIKAIVYASYTGGTQVLQVSGTQNFYFATGILPPNATSFITPTSGTYTGNVYISRYPATDANGGTLTYSISLTNSGQTTFITGLANNITATGFTWNSATVADGTYSLTGIICDSTALCTPFYLNDPFTTQNSAPIIYFTGSTPANGSTGYFNNFKPQIEMITTGGMNNFIYTFNGINYSYYDSGLVLMMNFDKVSALNETDGMIKDFSRYGNNGSGYGGVTRTNNGQRNGAYEFNGIGGGSYGPYIHVNDSNSLDVGYTTSMTISFRVYNDSNVCTALIKKSGMREIFRCSSSITIRFDGTDKSSNTVLYNNQRYHITVTRNISNNQTILYINGQQDTGWIYNVGTPTTTNGIGIGAYDGGLYSMDGKLDELRIRNRALSSGEIYQMRRSNLSKITNEKRLFTDDRQCMANGTYTYTGYVSNMVGFNASTGRKSSINITGHTPYAPEGYYIGSTGVSSTQTILSGQFTGYFKLEDWKGTTGWYTTIQLPLSMIGINYPTNNIINNGSNIKFMATGVDTEPGGTNSGMVYIYTGVNTYTGSTGSLHYIKRYDTQSYYCPAGIYENKPYISVDIPAYQNPDTYSGTITINFNSP